MRIDIILVTYNSKKYIKNCLESIFKSDYDLNKVGILVYDNNSNDETISILKELKEEYAKKLATFQIIEGEKNLGFGVANNLAAKNSLADYLFFLNIDCEIYPDTLTKLEEEINKRENFGILELKQTPYEHPKYYDPITLETKWSSGACFIIKKSLFFKVGGFDKNIFMYCEDVDLSYKIRRLGEKIYYLNNISIIHYSYNEKEEFKRNQYVNTIANNLYLRFKYGTFLDIMKGFYTNIVFYRNIEHDKNIPSNEKESIKKDVLKNRHRMIFKGIIEWFKRIRFIFNKKQDKLDFFGLEYCGVKEGAFYEIKETKEEPLVSILVRTCNRPSYLRENLISIRNQTYKNIEVVVVEDGKPTAKEMIEKEFKDLNIIYYATGENVGRCAVGNKALELATGKYLNFLDDDDVFYPDHVETLVGELENSKEKVAYTTAFETPIEIYSKDPYKYKVLKQEVVYSTKFSLLKILYSNITPIQAVMFEKEVCEECGGFDLRLDALEDWELWIRFALKYPFKYVKRTTSIYRVPAKKDDSLKRQEFLTKYLELVREEYKNTVVSVKGKEIPEFCQYCIQVNSNPRNEKFKRILRFLKILK